ncbi:histidine phosphatase family protein [Catenuloplanes japonicus]|uniref:histidine phosphatase family protein n=1 Tax=Catenuloplanes japonicus TaxID=33876 RepID=UPI00052517B0|nr:histidine phosphatase family protein [Catenuloplanes japonicus]
MRELVLVRHGQSVANAAFAAAMSAGSIDSGITGRDADVTLSPLGRTQATALGAWLAGTGAAHRPDAVVCSPYVRAVRTWEAARDAAPGLPAAVTDARLEDRHMGVLELLTPAAITARFPEEDARRQRDGEFGWRPPGGESFGDVVARLRPWPAEAASRYAGQRLWVVAHDAVVLMLRLLIEDLTFDDIAGIIAAGPVANTSLTRYVARDGKLTLAEYNGVSHLQTIA